ncbi:MAG: glycoside hydrolase family 57 protein [bacterium]
MSSNTLKIAFLWHMHQPFYLDPFTNKFKMPWVRLHCVKDYLDMLLITEKFEKIKPVFNFTPSLIQQIEYYLKGTKELHLELTLKSPADLTPSEKNIILKDFFMANWDTMIKPFPRYYELLLKRGTPQSQSEYTEVQRFFNKQDLLDLQLLFNLAWVDPVFRESDPLLKELVKKGRYYTEQDKELLIQKHFEIMKRIVSSYKNAFMENRIEISVSPFCHPILPLLIDNYIATKSDPSTLLPSQKFQYPQDAMDQINSAVNFAETRFGKKVQGMWPSEGSVSNETLSLIARANLKWTATDENILSKSLNMSNLAAETLYKPYRYDSSTGPVHLFFRDHRLSDNIGFVYSRMSAEDASEHFIKALHNIRSHLDAVRPKDDYIVSVILDGENAWEFYQNDGIDFLNLLYQKLERDNLLEVITFSEYLERYPHHDRLANIHPGSWINANFKIWIGHNEDNRAWDLLTDARKAIEEKKEDLSKEVLADVMQSLYIAEGSDWCWWYGDEHSTEFDVEFDELFRDYVKDIYRKLNIDYPPTLDNPIVKKEKEIKPDKEMVNFVTPKIDGRVTSYFEWLGSYVYDLKKFGFAMHRTHVYFETLCIGFDYENIYFRLDPERGFLQKEEYFPAEITISCNNDFLIKGVIENTGITSFSLKAATGEHPLDTAFSKIVEIKVPLTALNLKEEENISFFIYVRLKDSESIRFPARGSVNLTVPSKNFEQFLWHA